MNFEGPAATVIREPSLSGSVRIPGGPEPVATESLCDIPISYLKIGYLKIDLWEMFHVEHSRNSPANSNGIAHVVCQAGAFSVIEYNSSWIPE